MDKYHSLMLHHLGTKGYLHTLEKQFIDMKKEVTVISSLILILIFVIFYNNEQYT